MCVVSMIMDYQRDKWYPQVPQPSYYPFTTTQITIQNPITQAEIDEFRKLLERAREYDKLHNEPNCELQEKKDALRAVAKALGIDDKLDFLDE